MDKGSVVESKIDCPIFSKGQIGIVFDVYDVGFSIIFENGEYCGFGVDEIDGWLNQLPLVSYEAKEYKFENVIKLMNDYNDDVFKFSVLKEAKRLI